MNLSGIIESNNPYDGKALLCLEALDTSDGNEQLDSDLRAAAVVYALLCVANRLGQK